jgi:hypothetical protein
MKVHVHGNCQSYVISKMLREIYPEWEITCFEVHADPIVVRNDDYRRTIQTADVILSQPVHDGYRGRSDLSLNWIRSAAKPGCQVLVIPAMHFEGHHPGFGYLGLGDLCSSATAAHLVAVGTAPDLALDMLLGEDLFDSAFVHAEIDISISEMLRREQHDKIQVPLSPIARYFRGPHQLFHIVNHPTRPLYAFIINGSLDELSFGRRVAIDGPDHQDGVHIPMYAAVAFHTFTNEVTLPEWAPSKDRRVHLPNYPAMPQETYFRSMIDQLMRHSRQAILAALHASPKSAAFLKRLATSKNLLPGIGLWLVD